MAVCDVTTPPPAGFKETPVVLWDSGAVAGLVVAEASLSRPPVTRTVAYAEASSAEFNEPLAAATAPATLPSDSRVVHVPVVAVGEPVSRQCNEVEPPFERPMLFGLAPAFVVVAGMRAREAERMSRVVVDGEDGLVAAIKEIGMEEGPGIR